MAGSFLIDPKECLHLVAEHAPILGRNGLIYVVCLACGGAHHARPDQVESSRGAP